MFGSSQLTLNQQALQGFLYRQVIQDQMICSESFSLLKHQHLVGGRFQNLRGQRLKWPDSLIEGRYDHCTSCATKSSKLSGAYPGMLRV